MQFSDCTKQCNTLAKCAKKLDIFETTAHNCLHKMSSNQEGSSPLLSQLSTTVVRQLLDFGGEECVDDKDKRLRILSHVKFLLAPWTSEL